MNAGTSRHGRTFIGVILLMALVFAVFIYLRLQSEKTVPEINVYTASTRQGSGPYVAVRNKSDEPVDLWLQMDGHGFEFSLEPEVRIKIGVLQGFEFSEGKEFKIGGDGFKATTYVFSTSDEPQ